MKEQPATPALLHPGLHTTDIDGIPTRYEVTGQGRPLLLMHGWGCNLETVRSIAAAASATHTVVNIDFPGFGHTPEPPAVWGIDEYTAWTRRLIDTLGLDTPALAGHSFGGRVAIMLASQMPVSKVMLIDAAGVKPRRPLKYYIKVYSFKAAKAWYKLAYGSRANDKIEAMRRGRGSADYNAASPRMRAILSRVVNRDLRHAMPLIKAPTLLVWGDKDTATPVRDARIMERLIPGSGLVIFPGCGHYSFLDNPVQFAAVTRSFLSSND